MCASVYLIISNEKKKAIQISANEEKKKKRSDSYANIINECCTQNTTRSLTVTWWEILRIIVWMMRVALTTTNTKVFANLKYKIIVCTKASSDNTIICVCLYSGTC